MPNHNGFSFYPCYMDRIWGVLFNTILYIMYGKDKHVWLCCFLVETCRLLSSEVYWVCNKYISWEIWSSNVFSFKRFYKFRKWSFGQECMRYIYVCVCEGTFPPAFTILLVNGFVHNRVPVSICVCIVQEQ
jgi:hypothetical protein